MPDLYEVSWPVADAKAAVVITHGLAEHSGRYTHVAQALNAAGYAVYAFDHRGHGRSVGFPADMGDDPDQLVRDVVAECALARAEHDKIFLLAHSMGTIFAIPAATEIPVDGFAGLILSGTALVPAEATMNAMAEGKSLPPETVSRDPAVVQAYIDDPLVFTETPKLLAEKAIDAVTRAIEAIAKIEVPVLLIHGTADQLTSIEGANLVYAQLIVSDKTLKGYEGLYHEVLNEPEKDQVIADVIAWLDAH